ncbi:MAG: aminopeptidase P N-terminal domain-containing protein [Marinilabiliales bacterium]|nr:aminopeptidase P N-terminal domain-containing protein [Marinilabiliales bacterium]
MKGESHTYSWADGAARREGVLRRGDAGDCSIGSATWTPPAHQWLVRPAGGNILRVNLKAQLQPLRHRRPEERGHRLLRRGDHPGAVDLPLVEPLARLPADPLERPLGPGPRPGLAQLPGPHPILAALRGDGGRRDDAHAERPDRQAGRSPCCPWPSPGCRRRRWTSRAKRSAAKGSIPTERAFVVARHGAGRPRPRRRSLSGPAKESPAVNPALRIRHWDAPLPRVEIDGRPRAARQGRPGRVDTRSRRRRPRPLDPGRMDLARPDLDRSGRRDRQSGVAMNRRLRLAGWAAGLLVLAGPLTAALTFEPGEYAARRARFMEKIRDGAAVFLGALGARDRTVAFRQGHDFAYLTGVRDPERLPRRRRPQEGERPVLHHDARPRRTSEGIPRDLVRDPRALHRRSSGSFRPISSARYLAGLEPADRVLYTMFKPEELGPGERQREVQRPAEDDDAEPVGRAAHPGTPVRQAAARQVPAGRRSGTARPRSGSSARSSRRPSSRSCAGRPGSASRPTTP